MDNAVPSGIQVEFAILADKEISLPQIPKGPQAIFHPTCGRPAEFHRCDRRNLLNDLKDLYLSTVTWCKSELLFDIESREHPAGGSDCGVIT